LPSAAGCGVSGIGLDYRSSGRPVKFAAELHNPPYQLIGSFADAQDLAISQGNYGIRRNPNVLNEIGVEDQLDSIQSRDADHANTWVYIGCTARFLHTFAVQDDKGTGGEMRTRPAASTTLEEERRELLESIACALVATPPDAGRSAACARLLHHLATAPPRLETTASAYRLLSYVANSAGVANPGWS
jgi:hypothetical protein